MFISGDQPQRRDSLPSSFPDPVSSDSGGHSENEADLEQKPKSDVKKDLLTEPRRNSYSTAETIRSSPRFTATGNKGNDGNYSEPQDPVYGDEYDNYFTHMAGRETSPASDHSASSDVSASADADAVSLNDSKTNNALDDNQSQSSEGNTEKSQNESESEQEQPKYPTIPKSSVEENQTGNGGESFEERYNSDVSRLMEVMTGAQIDSESSPKLDPARKGRRELPKPPVHGKADCGDLDSSEEQTDSGNGGGSFSLNNSPSDEENSMSEASAAVSQSQSNSLSGSSESAGRVSDKEINSPDISRTAQNQAAVNLKVNLCRTGSNASDSLSIISEVTEPAEIMSRPESDDSDDTLYEGSVDSLCDEDEFLKEEKKSKDKDGLTEDASETSTEKPEDYKEDSEIGQKDGIEVAASESSNSKEVDSQAQSLEQEDSSLNLKGSETSLTESAMGLNSLTDDDSKGNNSLPEEDRPEKSGEEKTNIVNKTQNLDPGTKLDGTEEPQGVDTKEDALQEPQDVKADTKVDSIQETQEVKVESNEDAVQEPQDVKADTKEDVVQETQEVKADTETVPSEQLQTSDKNLKEDGAKPLTEVKETMVEDVVVKTASAPVKCVTFKLDETESGEKEKGVKDDGETKNLDIDSPANSTSSLHTDGSRGSNQSAAEDANSTKSGEPKPTLLRMASKNSTGIPEANVDLDAVEDKPSTFGDGGCGNVLVTDWDLFNSDVWQDSGGRSDSGPAGA